MSRIYTREELTAMTPETYKALTPEEQAEVRKQGKAFMAAAHQSMRDV